MSLNIGLIGFGRLGQAIATGIVQLTEHALSVSSPSLKNDQQHPFIVSLGNSAVVDAAETLIIAVKPNKMAMVLNEIAPRLTDRHCLVSVAAGVSVAQISSSLPGASVPIVRAMPNIMISLGQSPTPLYAATHCPPPFKTDIHNLFSQLGAAFWLEDESTMALATAIVGCGPAFIYDIMHDLTDAATQLGWPQQSAAELVQQLVWGCCQQLQHGQQNPQTLIGKIATKGGVTEQGLLTLRQAKLVDTFKATLHAALTKAKTE